MTEVTKVTDTWTMTSEDEVEAEDGGEAVGMAEIDDTWTRSRRRISVMTSIILILTRRRGKEVMIDEECDTLNRDEEIAEDRNMSDPQVLLCRKCTPRVSTPRYVQDPPPLLRSRTRCPAPVCHIHRWAPPEP